MSLSPFDTNASSSRAARGHRSGDDFAVIAVNISTIIRAIPELDKLDSDLGGPRDGSALRNTLRTKREETQRLANETRALLMSDTVRADRIRHDKLSRQFNEALKEFEKSSNRSLRHEREIVAQRLSQLEAEKNPLYRDAYDGPRLDQLQLTEVRASIVEDEILQERNRDIQQIEMDLQALAECFIDVAVEVEEQGEMLNQVEQNTDVAAYDTTDGVGELREAARLANSARFKILAIVCLVAVLIIIIVVVTVYEICGIPNKHCNR